MMVIDYAINQIGLDSEFTGIETQQLMFLAHSILQNGSENLSPEYKMYLAHLKNDERSH